MAMRVGEMMVIVRAQDFASRTLRRVGSEFSHLSREQQLAFRKQQLAWQKYDAKASRLAANESVRQMNMVRDYRRVTDDLATMASQRARLQERLARAQTRLAVAQPRGASGKFLPGADFTRIQRAQRAVSAYEKQLKPLIATETAATARQLQLNRALSQYPAWIRRGMNSTQAYASGLSRASRELEIAARNLTTAQHAQLAFDQAVRRMPLNRIQEFGHAMSGIGRTMQLFGAVGTVALGAAANAAANFNTEISLAATQARDLQAPVSQVQTRIDQLTDGFRAHGREVEGVLDLMQRFPAQQSDMAAASFDIFSSMNLMDNGITNVTEGLDLLEKANQIAVAGGEDLTTATNAMITVFNNFDPQLTNTTETLDTMFDIIRFGRMRLGDFNTMMNKVAPAAAGAGLSLRDVGGAMAFLTEVMPSQRMVATGISRLIEALNHPDIVKGLKMLKVNVRTATGEMRPLDQIMQDLAARFPKLARGQQTAAEFFKMVSRTGREGGLGVMFTAEGRKALTQIITHMDQYLDRQRQIDQNTGEFGAATTAQMQSLGVQWQIFLNRVRAIVIAIGTDAIPVFTELGNVLKKVLDWWQRLNPETRQTIVRMAVLASVATVVGGAVLALGGAFLGIMALLGRFGMRLTTVAGFMTSLTKSVRFLGALGAISLIINVIRKGDVGAWDLLMGALSGAAIGAGFGPWGALAGGLIIPITMLVAADESRNLMDEVADKIEADSKQKWPAMREYGRYLGANVRQGITEGLMDYEEFLDMRKMAETTDKLEGNRAALNRAATAKATRDLKNETAGVSDAQKNYNKAMDAYEKKQKKYTEALREYKNEMRNHKRAVKEYNENLARATVQANEEVIKSARDMYMQLQQINQQAMGELFQGPLLGGEAFNLAKEWGITAGIDSMIKDLRQANARFQQIQKGFAQLAKKGIPIEMIQEIQKMSPEDQLSYIQGILKGTPKQQAELIKAFKARNKAVQDQTKMDFVDEIERFRKAGVSMGEAIKNGFREAQVGAWFDSWVRVTFPNVIQAAVNQSVAEWKKTNPPPAAPKRPVAPVQPTPPGSYTASPSPGVLGTAGNDYSTTTVNIYMGDSGGTAREKLEDARRVGFIMRQAGLGRSRIIGTPFPSPKGTGPRGRNNR